MARAAGSANLQQPPPSADAGFNPELSAAGEGDTVL